MKLFSLENFSISDLIRFRVIIKEFRIDSLTLKLIK